MIKWKTNFSLILLTLLILIIFTYILIQYFYIGEGPYTCAPGFADTPFIVNFSAYPELTGIKVEPISSCYPSSNGYPMFWGFEITNYENEEVLIYVDAEGGEHELWPYQNSIGIEYDVSLPYCKNYGYDCVHYCKCDAVNGSIFTGYKCDSKQVCCYHSDTKFAMFNSSYREENIPKDIGSKLTRELYFSNSPEIKYVLTLKPDEVA